MTKKLVSVWVLGGILITFGAWIVNNLEKTIGVSDFSYATALFIAFVAFLLAGLCWISVAVATKH